MNEQAQVQPQAQPQPQQPQIVEPNPTIVVAKAQPKNKVIIAISIGLVAIVLIGIAGIFFYTADQRHKKALVLSEDFKNESTSLALVNTSLTDLYKKITNNKMPGASSQSNFNRYQQVLGAAVSKLAKEGTESPSILGDMTNTNPTVYTTLYETGAGLEANMKNTNKSMVFKKQSTPEVKGLTSDTETLYRQINRISKEGSEKAKDASAKLAILKTDLEEVSDSQLKSSLKDSDETVKTSEEYITAASNVHNYYTVLSDINVKILPVTVSVYQLYLDIYKSPSPRLYLTQVDELIKTVRQTQDMLNAIPEDKVPKGMEDLHSDNKKVLVTLIEFLNDMKTSVERLDSTLFLDSGDKFSSTIKLLATRSYTYEQSFWQNSNLSKTYEALNTKYKDHQDAMQKLTK